MLDVDAGTGDDVVDTTAALPGHYLTTILGAGADTFVGGRADDAVYAGEQARTPNGGYAGGSDTEKDTIDTGEDGDAVFSGSPGVPNRDAVTLGLGDDDLYLVGSALTSRRSSTPARAPTACPSRAGPATSPWTCPQGTFTSSQGTARFTAFEPTRLAVGAGTVTYRGTEGDDSVTVRPTGGVPTWSTSTGGGDDELILEPAALAPGSRIDLGAGTDDLVAATETGRLALDLRPSGSASVDGRRGRRTASRTPS